MGWLEFTLLGIVATFMALNQAVKDSSNLTARMPWLRIPGWANYIPAVLLIPVLLLRLSSEFQQSNDPQPSSGIANVRPSQSGGKLDPNTLPESVSQAYVTLMSGDHTDLREVRFLAAHSGKYLDLTLELASLSRDGELWRAQFRAGDNAGVFAYFPRQWEDHLLSKNVGDMIHFRAKIVERGDDYYELVDAEPL